jgi:uncharacterized protein (TIGR02246 family)
MKAYLVLAVACLAFQAAPASAAQAPQPFSSHSHQSSRCETQPDAGIERLLNSYQQSLDASDVAGVVRLFTDDGVLLPPNAPSAVGTKIIRASYTALFKTVSLDLTFKIAEIRVLTPDWAFLRSDSSGTITTLATGAHAPSANHELFIMHKSQGCWKIARYAFSSTLQP